MRQPTPSPAQQRRDRWQEAYIEARRSGSGIFPLIELADQEQANLHAEVARLHAELHDAESGCVLDLCDEGFDSGLPDHTKLLAVDSVRAALLGES